MNRDELAGFLRNRRARVTPSDVGLPGGGRRRTPGLRRQEVAQLAGMSIDYYIRLEQGRGPHPSRQVLGALGRALMLDQDERNVIRWVFMSPGIAEHLSDEEKGRFARASVADLRVAAGRYPDDRALRALVAEMPALSPEFAELWARHEVEVRREQRKQVIHPVVGTIDAICQVLPVPDRDDLRLVLYTTEPGSPSHRALRDLRRLTLSS
ncbi:helix-turn-helix transcriptional regulator [Nonomuraea sp. NPDC001023]|uniref:helix-turn-helix transcriptional regulator n=1 Tax=unclassified Nonomuraea TaxID=2593643 RepID=UPI00332DA704